MKSDAVIFVGNWFDEKLQIFSKTAVCNQALEYISAIQKRTKSRN